MPSTPIDDQYQQAMSLVKGGQLDAARQALESLLAGHNDHLPTRFALGGLLSEAGELDAAIPHYLAILDIEENHLDSHLALAHILYRQQRFANAEGAYTHVLGLDAGNVEAGLGLARSRWQLGHHDDALEQLRNLLEAHPGSTDGWHLLAQLAARLERWPESVLACDALIGAGIDAVEIQIQRAAGLSRLRQWEAAEAAYRQIVDRQADNHQAWVGLATTHGARNQRKQARKASRQALKVRPRQPIDHGDIVVIRNLGPSYYQLSPEGHVVLERENNIDHHLSGLPVQELYLDQIEADRALKQELGRAGLIINAVADPDRDPTALDRVSKLLNGLNCPVINPPAQVALCTRDRNWQRFIDTDGIHFPRTLRSSSNRVARDLADAGMPYPVILRRVGTHMGASVTRADDTKQLQRFVDNNPDAPLYLIEYVDNPFLPGVYRRLRMMCVGEQRIAIGCHYHRHWNVHSSDRGSVMQELEQLRAEEARFVEDAAGYLGEAAMQAIERIADVVQLGYFGIDFDLLPDGRLLIFEINAAMAPNSKVLKDFPYLKPAFAELERAVRQLAKQHLGND